MPWIQWGFTYPWDFERPTMAGTTRPCVDEAHARQRKEDVPSGEVVSRLVGPWMPDA